MCDKKPFSWAQKMWQESKLLSWLSGYEASRKRLLAKAPAGILRDFLSLPCPSTDTRFAELPILSVDFETTGLDSKKDKLLSVGFVNLQGGQIRLSDYYHQVIQTEGKLKHDNVLIHQITDDVKARGLALETVVESLLEALAGKVMLVHCNAIEKPFLAQACMALYGMAPVYPIIDTMALAKRLLDRRNTIYAPSALHLASLRSHYNLPEHFAHNALNDAIATAELLLAQVAHMSNGDCVTLSDLLSG